MKLTRKKLKKLIEAFISGPEGTINLDAEPYEYMKYHPDPTLAALAKKGPESATQAAMFSDRDTDYNAMAYEQEVRKDPAFDPKKYQPSPGSSVSNVYSHMMALYDNDPNFEADLKEKIFDYIGNSKDLTDKKRYFTLQETADRLAEEYFQSEFFDIDGILEFEADNYLSNLGEEDGRLIGLPYTSYNDQVALNQKGRKSLEQIVKEAFEESGLKAALGHIYDSYDFGLP